jgi:hypothetical protein
VDVLKVFAMCKNAMQLRHDNTALLGALTDTAKQLDMSHLLNEWPLVLDDLRPLLEQTLAGLGCESAAMSAPFEALPTLEFATGCADPVTTWPDDVRDQYRALFAEVLQCAGAPSSSELMRRHHEVHAGFAGASAARPASVRSSAAASSAARTAGAAGSSAAAGAGAGAAARSASAASSGFPATAAPPRLAAAAVANASAAPAAPAAAAATSSAGSRSRAAAAPPRRHPALVKVTPTARSTNVVVLCDDEETTSPRAPAVVAAVAPSTRQSAAKCAPEVSE